MGRKRHSDDIEDTSQFKSKNLKAERKRREKLSNRLLTLRALVPLITNVTTQHHLIYSTYLSDFIKCASESYNFFRQHGDGRYFVGFDVVLFCLVLDE